MIHIGLDNGLYVLTPAQVAYTYANEADMLNVSKSECVTLVACLQKIKICYNEC